MQSTIAVHCWVDGNDNVEGEGHGEYQIRRVLNLHKLTCLGAKEAIILLWRIIRLGLANTGDDQDKYDWAHNTAQVVKVCAAICRTEWIVNCHDQIYAQAQIHGEWDQLEERVEDLVRLAHCVKHLKLFFSVHVVVEKRDAQDPIKTEVADYTDWIENFH